MKDLHELAKEYAQNVIDKEAYRKSRSELIQGICAGEIPVKTREYLPPIESLSEDVDAAMENTLITQFVKLKQNIKVIYKPTKRPESKLASVSNTYILIGVGIIVLLLVILLASLLISTTDDSSTTETNYPAQSPSGQELIIEFIQQKNWSQENMAAFVRSWDMLSNQEHIATAPTPEMTRLINAIYQQLLDERALLSLDDVENAVANQERLINFANQLGIKDERLTVLKPQPNSGTDLK